MKYWEIQVDGMHCEGCTRSVKDALDSLPEIRVLSVDLSSGLAVMESAIEPEASALEAAIQAAGFQAGSPASCEKPMAQVPPLETPDLQREPQDKRQGPFRSRLELVIEGMHCASCVSHVRSALLAVPQVEHAAVNLATGRAAVGMSVDSIDSTALVQAIQRAGYMARMAEADSIEAERMDERYRQERRLWGIRFVLAACLTALQLLVRVPWLALADTTAAAMALVSGIIIQCGVGAVFYRESWRRLRRGGTGMDTLVVLGTTAAFCSALPGVLREGLSRGPAGLGMLVDAGMIFSFISLGRYLESRARQRAADSLQGLLRRMPRQARVRREEVIDVAPEDVAVGEIVVVRPGEQVPLDGEIVTGETQLDESWLSGESLPVSRGPGEQVFASTMNGQGVIEVRVSCHSSDTAFAGIINLVHQLQQQSAPIQRLADKVVSVFVPCVVLIAAITATSWYLAGDLEQLARSTVSVLVVACPCALGLATPIALLVAGGRGARLGLLVTHPEALETAAAVDTVVLDKTGTLTEGKPRLKEIVMAEMTDEERILSLAASVESMSFHPLAWAVVEEARGRGILLHEPRQVTEVPGEGIQATVDESWVGIGNRRYLERLGFDLASRPLPERDDGTLLYVLVDGQLAGTLVVEDPLREESRQVITRLHDMGMETLLLSGDREEVAERIGDSLGIQSSRGSMSPTAKQEVLAELQGRGKTVAFVGDGINDAPSLVAADLGIAIGAGADVARQSADVVLMTSDVSGVARVLELSRRTVRVIRQNLAWAGLYNICLLPLAAGLFQSSWGIGVPPWLAALAMSASSLAVVLNSLRLGRVRLERPLER